MTLDRILQQIGQQSQPPVERWDPEFCGDLDMVIKRNGDWYYQGTPIGRLAMVKLFGSILKREGDRHFLVTPVEKVGIQVESTPFLVTRAEQIEGTWILTNSLSESVPLDAEHPLDTQTDQECPQIIWRRNLMARISQNVMYQWQTYALDEGGLDAEKRLWLESAGQRHLLARL